MKKFNSRPHKKEIKNHKDLVELCRIKSEGEISKATIEIEQYKRTKEYIKEKLTPYTDWFKDYQKINFDTVKDLENFKLIFNVKYVKETDPSLTKVKIVQYLRIILDCNKEIKKRVGKITYANSTLYDKKLYYKVWKTFNEQLLLKCSDGYNYTFGYGLGSLRCKLLRTYLTEANIKAGEGIWAKKRRLDWKTSNEKRKSILLKGGITKLFDRDENGKKIKDENGEWKHNGGEEWQVWYDYDIYPYLRYYPSRQRVLMTNVRLYIPLRHRQEMQRKWRDNPHLLTRFSLTVEK